MCFSIFQLLSASYGVRKDRLFGCSSSMEEAQRVWKESRFDIKKDAKQQMKQSKRRSRRRNLFFYSKNVLLGKNSSPFKRVYYALKVFKGVRLFRAEKLCDRANVHRVCKVEDLKESHLSKLKTVLQSHLERKKMRICRIRMLKSLPNTIIPS